MRQKRSKLKSKKTPSQKTRARDEELRFSRDEPSIQSAANVAAQLLPWCNDLNEAVRVAYGVFDVCREQAEHRSIEQLVQTSFEPSNMESFHRAIATITGRKDPNYALKLYKEFCEEVVWPLWVKMKDPTSKGAGGMMPSDKDSDVKKLVTTQRDKGIPKMQVAAFQALFALTKPKRRKTPKSKRRWGTLALDSSDLI